MIALLAGGLSGAAGEASQSVARTSQWPCSGWGMYGRTLDRSFSTDCSPIDRSTVVRLMPAWFVKTPKTVTASPVIVGDTLFVGDWSGTMFALDSATGAERWRFQTAPAPGATFGPIVSSAAVAEISGRRLVIFGSGPRMYALDARSGTVVWDRYVGAVSASGRPKLAADPAEVESSPAVWRNTVYVGMDTHNEPDARTGGVRGGLLALDAATGRVRWKFEPDAGAGCGGVWSSPAIDTKRGRVYFGSANCPSSRRRDWTPYVEAVVALDAFKGTPLWSFRPHGLNRDDLDFGSTPNLFVDPSGIEVLGVGNKDGTYYALNPATGRLRWSANAAEPGVVDEDFSIGGFIGSAAVHEGRVYGGTAIGGAPYFHAMDGDDGALIWRGVQAPTYAASAVVNGVVFSGALDDGLRAYDADTGRPLWSAPLAGPISSGPAIAGPFVYVGSGTSSSDACEKDAPGDDACATVFDEVLGQTGGIHGFRLAVPSATAATRGRVLFSPQGNQLDVYDLGREPPSWRAFIPEAARGGKDLNGQVCRLTDRHILLGEDSGQTKGVPQGWGIFDVDTRRQVGKLIATYPRGVATPEPHGCAVERDRRGRITRIFVSQVGSGNFEAADGQLIVFFASSSGLDAVLGRRTPRQVCPRGDCSGLTTADADFCVIHAGIRSAGSITMDARGRIYVPEFAPTAPPSGAAPGRVLLFDGPFPRSSARCVTSEPSTFIQDAQTATPGAIAAARDARGRPTGHWYVSSVIFPPVVNEYDAGGAFVRNVLPPGFATPFGLAVDRAGTMYVADLGIDFDPTRIPDNPDRVGIDTHDGEGSVLRVRFVDGSPQPPEYLKTGLDYPDGLGLLE